MPDLPLELYKDIGQALLDSGQQHTFANLCVSSKGHHRVLSPLLYRRIVLRRDNARAVFQGLKFPPEAEPNGVMPCLPTPKGLWPEVSLPNEEKTAWVEDPNISTLHSDNRSHYRKLRMLCHIRHLHIASIPNISLCHALCRLIAARKAAARIGKARKDRLFHNVESLILGEEAVWELADWHSRISIPSIRGFPHSSPSTLLFGLECRPKTVCIQNPTFTDVKRMAWIRERMGDGALVETITTAQERVARLERLWTSFVKGGVWRVMLGMLMCWQPERVFQHNLVSGRPLPATQGEVVVNFGPCQCRIDTDTDWSAIICPNHTDEEARISVVASLFEAMKQTASIDFSHVSFRFVGMADQLAEDGDGNNDERAERMKCRIEEYLLEHELRNTIEFSASHGCTLCACDQACI